MSTERTELHNSGHETAAPTATFPGVTLLSEFADALPELALPWESAAPANPSLLVLNNLLATELSLDADALRTVDGVRFLLGNALAEGSKPVAQVYAGHQFGGYSRRLGDGRALLLGELQAPGGALVDLHLKGSGRTPFSRGGDGFAAVGPMLREYLISESMHALGVPTTRSLAVVATGTSVERETILPGAVLVRTAASHLRVGSFQFVSATEDLALLQRLTDVAVARHYPEIASDKNSALSLLKAVIAAQASLTAQWMLIGFVHGVLNTDNVAISGQSIDYGPCAFIDAYDPAARFSSIDREGRYSYGSQPEITLWNLTRFAETLLPLISYDQSVARELAIAALHSYYAEYQSAWTQGMRAKLGLGNELHALSATDADVADIAAQMLGEMHTHQIDFTNFFRSLGAAAMGDDGQLRALYADCAGPGQWLKSWLAYSPDGAAMSRVNPLYIPRNHLTQEALDTASEGNLGSFNELLAVLCSPFDEQPGKTRYAQPAPADSSPFVTFCGT